MAKSFDLSCRCFSIALIFIVNSVMVTADGDRKLHVVYMGSLPREEYSLSSQHLNLLQELTRDINAENLLVRSYNRSFNGFAAMLSDSEAKQLASSKEVVSIFPSENDQAHTTRSWSFIGFEETAHRNLGAESDLVIGVIDSGIWPESESFNDEGFGPPPKKWKGTCKGGNNFTCNNKLIGARNYVTTGPTANTARDYAGHDRRILDKVILGSGTELIGNSVNSFDLKGQSFPLIKGSDAKLANCSDSDASSCYYMCLNGSLVKGKIVVCTNAGGYLEAFRTGAVGCVLQTLGTYMNSVKNPVAQILKSEAVKDSTAPLVASFSSRGPNIIVPDLLKPDVVAPGVDILAAFSPAALPSFGVDDRRVKYNIKSGTSMACPHAAAVGAYVKTFNPNFSPAAIQSAIITTAFPMNATADPNAELSYGSGLINPLRACYVLSG
ncbi:Subtilisin-like protease SBT4.4 [Euphorbia peplus]|nr:Subtilisin-like protease SBT4.4 [Euphorbia peplus]